MEAHCHREHQQAGVCITLRREDGVGCFAGALPHDLRAQLVNAPQAWTEMVRGAGALTLYMATYQDAQTAAGIIVRALDDGVLVAEGQGAADVRTYWVLQESADPSSDIVLMFPHLYVLPPLARAVAQGNSAITGHWAVPYTGGEWRAVGGGGGGGEARLWSDPPPPDVVWLRTPRRPLLYAVAAGPELVRIVTRKEPDDEAWWSADFRDVLAPLGLTVDGALTPEVALVSAHGRQAALYRCHGRHGAGLLWYDDSGCVEATPLPTWPGRERREGSVCVAPVTSSALECPPALRTLPRSAIGHVSFPAYGVRWWAPPGSSTLRTLQQQGERDGRYESVGACDYIVFVHEFREGFELNAEHVADDARAMIARLLGDGGPFTTTPGHLADDPFSVRDIGDMYVTLLHFTAQRAHRPLLREAVAEFARRRDVAMRYQHWLPLQLAPPFCADERPHLTPANRWGHALHKSLEWAKVCWWPLTLAEPSYCDDQIAVWPGVKISRRFGDWVYTEYTADGGEEEVSTWQKAQARAMPAPPRVLNADGAVYPGEQIVGTHALVRVAWGGVCKAVPPTASLEDFSEDIDVRIRRLQPSLNECRVLPTVVGERFGDLVVPPSPGLTVVPMVAPCGAGKSTAALAFARVLADQRWRVLFVSPRTSVVEQTIALLRGMHFAPVDGRNKEALAAPGVSSAPCCVTTIHSLHRLAHTFIVPQPGAPRIALFLDEAVTAFTSDYNSHIIPAAKCERALMSFLAGPVRMAVLMDANLTPHLVGNFVERYVYGVRKMVGSRLTHLAVAVHPKVATYNMVTLQQRAALCYTAFDAPLQIFRLVRERLGAGRKVAIFFSRKKDLDVWRRAMEVGGGVAAEETLYYCADSKHPLGDLCARIQQGTRLFMYTSAAGAGVDLSFRDAAGDACEYFDTVAMVGASAPYLCPKDLEQAASRVRMTTELLVDLAGADVTGPLETMRTSAWEGVMNANEDEVLARALQTANCTAALARTADLDPSEWLQAPPEHGDNSNNGYGNTSPYARLLAYNHLADRAVPFRCQAFVATLARVGYATRVVPCPLPGDATLDSAALLLRAELMCDVEEGDDLYNHVLANQRRGAMGLPLLLAGEPYVQRVEECVKRLYERDTLDVAIGVKRLLEADVPEDETAWRALVRGVVAEYGVKATASVRGDRQPLGPEGVALRETLTSGLRGRKVLQVLGLYIATLATGLRGFFPLFEGTHIEDGSVRLPLLGALSRGTLQLGNDREEWLCDAVRAAGALFITKHGHKEGRAASASEVLNRYSAEFLGLKVYKRTRTGFKVDDTNSRMALLSVVAPGEEEARRWLAAAKEATVEFDRNVTNELPVESAPQQRKRRKLMRTESRLHLREREDGVAGAQQ